MPEVDQTITFSYSPDGTEHYPVNTSVGSGETWYADQLVLSGDGAGTNRPRRERSPVIQ